MRVSLSVRLGFAAGALTVVALAMVLAAAPAPAHFTHPQYSYKSSGDCQGPTDPVSLYYYGSAAVNHRVTDDIKQHLGWKHRSEGSNGVQYVRDHGACVSQWSGPSSRSGFGHSRYHVRLWGMNHKDTQGRWETVGTPHHEDWIWYDRPENPCGPPGSHAVDKGAVDRGKAGRTRQGSGFDQARRKIREKVNTRRHDIKIRYLGNTRSFKQCDKDYAGSNGNVLWVSFGRH